MIGGDARVRVVLMKKSKEEKIPYACFTNDSFSMISRIVLHNDRRLSSVVPDILVKFS